MAEIRCHAPSGAEGRRCDARLGEDGRRLRIIGVFNRWEAEVGERSDARLVKRCERCGWYNLFEIGSEERG